MGEVLNNEELLWKHKSRCDWLSLRDRNTKFFHNCTLTRRKSNRITNLRVRDGTWIYEPYEVQLEVVNYFQKLYEEQSSHRNAPHSHPFPQLEQCDINFLGEKVSNEEIKKALFDMTLMKALGSDRYHIIFFQSQWDSIGSTICNLVKGVFD